MGFFKTTKEEEFLDFIIGTKAKELKVKEMAIERCKDLIARTIAKSEFKIYSKKEDIKKRLYYRLNVRPNPNEDATSFFYRVVSKLLEKGEALIIPLEKEGQLISDLFVADNWDTTKVIMYSKNYKNIEISDLEGNSMKLKGVFSADDLIHLTLGDSKIKQTIDAYFKEYSELVNISSLNYKRSNVFKWLFKIPGGQPSIKDPKTNEVISYEDYKEMVLGNLFKDEETIVMLSEQFDISLLNEGKGKPSDDLKNLLTSGEESIAKGFNIPLDLYNGKITEKSNAINDFITFAVMPIIEIIEDGMNSKLIEEKDYLDGEKIKINKLRFKHYDIMDIATSIDKLMSNGFKLNEVFDILDLPKDKEDKMADKRRYTKNYATSEEIAKGGE